MSEPNGRGREAGPGHGQLAADADPEPTAEPAVAPDQDPWFEPARPHHNASASDSDAPYAEEFNGERFYDDGPNGEGSYGQSMYGAGLDDLAGGQHPDGDDSHRSDEWFLRTGRAGLLPDSMTVNSDEGGHATSRAETAAAPPWAGEPQGPEVEEPPPWESGPWPDPGDDRPEHLPQPARSVPAVLAPHPADDNGNWQAGTALVTGFLPLVLPGVILGVLGLRRAQLTGTGRTMSLAGIALSLVWAVVLIAVFATGSQPAPACDSAAQGAVHLAMQSVMRDLAGNAPESVVAADLNQAISQTNSAAAAAQQVSARNAMVALTNGLQQAMHAAAADHSPSSYAAIRRQLTAANGAEVTACQA